MPSYTELLRLWQTQANSLTHARLKHIEEEEEAEVGKKPSGGRRRLLNRRRRRPCPVWASVLIEARQPVV